MIFKRVPQFLRETQGADLPDTWRWHRCSSSLLDPLVVRFTGGEPEVSYNVNIAEYKAWYQELPHE